MFLLEVFNLAIILQGMYVKTDTKKWNLTVTPRIVPSPDEGAAEGETRSFYRAFLASNIGIDYGGWLRGRSRVESKMLRAKLLKKW